MWREENQRTQRKTVRAMQEPLTNLTHAMHGTLLESNPGHICVRGVLSSLHHPCFLEIHVHFKTYLFTLHSSLGHISNGIKVCDEIYRKVFDNIVTNIAEKFKEFWGKEYPGNIHTG